MSVLLIVSDVDGEALASSPLAGSLRSQSDTSWTFEPPTSEPLATVGVSADTRLRPGALDEVRRVFDAEASIDALIADAIVSGERQLRPAWSPTATAMGAATDLDLVAVRGRADVGTLVGRIDALGTTSAASIGQLPVALVERDQPHVLDRSAGTALERMLSRQRSGSAPSSASIIIPTAGTRGASGERHVVHAIDAARRCGIDRREILVVVGDEFDGDPDELAASDVRIVARPAPWNFSIAINTGLLEATHDAIVLLNDDIEAPNDGWAIPLIDHLRDPDIALVGTALLYPDGTLQHLGVIIDDALPLHPFTGRRIHELEQARHPREVAAVTAACAIGRRVDLLAVGGLNEALPANFNDVDLCFKLHRSVGRVILDPTSPLVHHESASRQPVIEAWEWEAFVGRWGEVVDPWYHPGHHRPDDPDDRRRNADHLPAGDPDGRWPVRTPTIHSTVHRARLAAPAASPAPE